MNQRDFEKIIQQIALRNHTTAAQVRKEMQEAMEEGMSNPDPKVQAAWSRIPRKGETLTLEEFIEYVARQI